jgi:hypothetical protein
MRSRFFVLSSLAAAVLVATPAHAHHGKDFLVVETVGLPHRGDVYFFSSQDFVSDDAGATAVEVSPAFLIGLSRGLAFELHGHAVREEGRWTYEATAPALRVQLPGAGRLRFGLGAEYEFAHANGARDAMEGRFIAGYQQGSTAFTVNLVAERAVGDEQPTEIGYAVGLRPNLGKSVGWGIEAQGGLRNREGHEVLLGLYAEPSERLTLKVGVGKGFGGGADWTARTGIVFRF